MYDLVFDLSCQTSWSRAEIHALGSIELRRILTRRKAAQP